MLSFDFRSVAWSKINQDNNDYIFAFGYNQDLNYTILKIPTESTYVVKLPEYDQELVDQISETLMTEQVLSSRVNKQSIIFRAAEITDISVDPNVEVVQDPYKELIGLFERLNLNPYDWLTVKMRYQPNMSLDVVNVLEQDISQSSRTDPINQKILFFDIETFSSKFQFPDSLNIDDAIISISVFTDQAQVLFKAQLDLEYEDFTLQGFNLEADLLANFMQVITDFEPDKIVFFNGDSYDMPYLINRLKLHNIELPAIHGFKPQIIEVTYQGPFGEETVNSVFWPSVEVIDLLHFYRLFYPQFRNHRLDTIALFFLGVGKTDLTIEQMMTAYKNQDLEMLAKVVEYSYIDAVRMIELWEATQVLDKLEIVSNNLSITNNMLLRYPVWEIINIAAFVVDPGAIFVRGYKGYPDHLIEAKLGIYRNVYLYDYSEIYRQLMLNSGQFMAKHLAEYLVGAPSKLITEAFYSKYVFRTPLMSQLNVLIRNMLNTDLIIAIEPFIIRSIGKLEELPWVELLSVHSIYAQVGKASYISMDQDFNLESAGLAKLAKPKFGLAQNLVRDYLIAVYNNAEVIMPNLDEDDLEEFLLTEKLTHSNSKKKVQLILRQQYLVDYSTWVIVKYLMTVTGAKVYDLQTPEYELDYDWYQAELDKYYKDLAKLPVIR